MALARSVALTPTCPAMSSRPLRTIWSLSFVSPAEVTSWTVAVWKSAAIFTDTAATPTPTRVVAFPSLVIMPPTPPILAVKDSPFAAASLIPRVNGAVSARSKTNRSATSATRTTAPHWINGAVTYCWSDARPAGAVYGLVQLRGDDRHPEVKRRLQERVGAAVAQPRLQVEAVFVRRGAAIRRGHPDTGTDFRLPATAREHDRRVGERAAQRPGDDRRP